MVRVCACGVGDVCYYFVYLKSYMFLYISSFLMPYNYTLMRFSPPIYQRRVSKIHVDDTAYHDCICLQSCSASVIWKMIIFLQVESLDISKLFDVNV